ncbi:hypothetical protein ColLi_13275 [Colletotrichum liriopes]|uniref:Uncharacterized protein n=1 Tax=Colletotrichum liriopes TaxID=708192 RepID=A0AA37H1Z4_9PEZI|nr:hypothetical protein ColLi_13275 [Colletotrichum liriopes]
MLAPRRRVVQLASASTPKESDCLVIPNPSSCYAILVLETAGAMQSGRASYDEKQRLLEYELGVPTAVAIAIAYFLVVPSHSKDRFSAIRLSALRRSVLIPRLDNDHDHHGSESESTLPETGFLSASTRTQSVELHFHAGFTPPYPSTLAHHAFCYTARRRLFLPNRYPYYIFKVLDILNVTRPSIDDAAAHQTRSYAHLLCSLSALSLLVALAGLLLCLLRPSLIPGRACPTLDTTTPLATPSGHKYSLTSFGTRYGPWTPHETIVPLQRRRFVLACAQQDALVAAESGLGSQVAKGVQVAAEYA